MQEHKLIQTVTMINIIDLTLIFYSSGLLLLVVLKPARPTTYSSFYAISKSFTLLLQPSEVPHWSYPFLHSPPSLFITHKPPCLVCSSAPFTWERWLRWPKNSAQSADYEQNLYHLSQTAFLQKDKHEDFTLT